MFEMELEVFRTGDYGDKGQYKEADLDALSADYDPKMHEAPVTVDHARSGPAYGWVKGLRRAGDRLLATIGILSGEFLDWVKSRAYKKPSIEIYRAFSRTGRPYLRALSFLGASPPEVKGLADPVFADEGEFAVFEWNGEQSLESPERAAQEPDPEREAFLRERESLKAEIETLKQQKRRAELAMFCERLKRDGRLLPAWEEKGLLDFLLTLDETRVLRFGEIGEQSPLAWFCSFLEQIPPLVCLREVAGEPQEPEPADLSLPHPSDGVAVSPESVETHKRAIAFQEKHPGMSYTEALSRVIRSAWTDRQR